MAKQTLEKLIQGDTEIINSYQRVKAKWAEALEGFDWESADAIVNMAKLVSEWQIGMEHAAGDRWLGQEIMVIVGIGQFHSSETGFDTHKEKAQIVYKGFANSMCSIEVKSYAKKAGTLYGLE